MLDVCQSESILSYNCIRINIGILGCYLLKKLFFCHNACFSSPVSGKDGKIARDMRERITQLLIDNEELRVAMAKQQFDSLPEGDTKAFSNALGTNYKLRLTVSKLT